MLLRGARSSWKTNNPSSQAPTLPATSPFYINYTSPIHPIGWRSSKLRNHLPWAAHRMYRFWRGFLGGLWWWEGVGWVGLCGWWWGVGGGCGIWGTHSFPDSGAWVAIRRLPRNPANYARRQGPPPPLPPPNRPPPNRPSKLPVRILGPNGVPGSFGRHRWGALTSARLTRHHSKAEYRLCAILPGANVNPRWKFATARAIRRYTG